MYGITVFISLKRVGMYYCITINNMCVVKKVDASEKHKKEKQKEILRNIKHPIFKHNCKPAGCYVFQI
jgi:hypothetical protein